jgi:hypothetical protein
MKFLFKITREKTQTLLNGVDFDINGFDIVFKDGVKIKFGDLNDVIVRNKEYVIYSNDTTTLKYARRIIEALYK